MGPKNFLDTRGDEDELLLTDLLPIDRLEDESFDYRPRLAPARGTGERPARADADIARWQWER